MNKIFEPIELKNIKSKNRLVRSATWEGIAADDGGIAENSYAIYKELAKGRVGIMITGFTSVADNDFYFGGMMRLSNDSLIPQYRKLTDIIHRENCPVITQLALGGYYKELPDGRVVELEPDDLSSEDIKDIIRLFSEAAVRASAAGFDGVQIHAAHFFFLSRFISPLANHRKDLYGGSTENRGRILVDILKAINIAVPNLHVSVKINSSDFSRSGLDEEQCLIICKALATAGIDSIEVSGNGTSVRGIKPHVNEAYFLDFAARLAKEVDVPVMLVGGLRSKATMEYILNNTDIALLSLSRPLVREPDLPDKLQSGKSEEATCISCNACYSTPAHRCIFRIKESH